MTTAYQGRHARGTHPTPAAVSAPTRVERRPQPPAERRTRPPAHGFSYLFRRPVASAAAILALAGVCAAGSSEATANDSSVAFTASPMAAEQATELAYSRNDTDTSLAAARRSGVQRASVLTHQQAAAAAALVRARVQAAEALVRARVEAAARVAREHERQGLLDRARSDPRSVGRLLAADRGWGEQQYDCLNSLWTKESGWRWNADNPGSDAYGIPQALPGSKMSSVGSDWATNPITQINWGLSYIANRYGTPCSAWSQSRAANWY